MFHTLVEEKTGHSKNSRFAQDYKTLADVIIQETIRKDLGEKFPPILEHILGKKIANYCCVKFSTRIGWILNSMRSLRGSICSKSILSPFEIVRTVSSTA